MGDIEISNLKTGYDDYIDGTNVIPFPEKLLKDFFKSDEVYGYNCGKNIPKITIEEIYNENILDPNYWNNDDEVLWITENPELVEQLKLPENDHTSETPASFRRFILYRYEDESGVSGTGTVAYGVQFPDGQCALRWNTAISSTAIYSNILQVERIHGHEGKTRIEWIDL